MLFVVTGLKNQFEASEACADWLCWNQDTGYRIQDTGSRIQDWNAAVLDQVVRKSCKIWHLVCCGVIGMCIVEAAGCISW